MIQYRTSAHQFDHAARFYVDFRQEIYPELAGSPTFTLITSGDNQPGSHNLTGGYASYLLDLTAEVTVSVRCKPTFTYDTGSNQPLVSWYNDATHYLTLYYDSTSDAYTLKWRDGGTERILESSAYIDNPSLQVWTDVAFAVDLANGIGNLFIDRSSVDSSWSGVADTKSSNFPTFEIRAENGSAGAYNINHARVFTNLEASSAQVANNFLLVENEETFFPLNGVAFGGTRCNVTQMVTRYSYKGEAEKEKTAAIAANTLDLTLKSFQGEFADDQYAAFDPTNHVYNGTSAQAYMKKRCRVMAERWWTNDGEPFFVGRLTPECFKRRTTDSMLRSFVTVEAEDFAGELARHAQRYTIRYDNKKISDATEADSLVHILTRLASQREVKNYLANSSFENATISNSWTVSGTGATFSRVAGGLFGSYQGDLVYGSATCEVQQTVTFTGEEDNLNVGETYTFSAYLKSASACGYNLVLEEADSVGANDSSSAAWSVSGGDGWQRFTVSHTITDSTSDRLVANIQLDDNVTLSCDAAMLILGSRALNWFVLNNNDGAAGVEAAEDADSDNYDQLGFDVDAVNATQIASVVSERENPWDHLQQIADATAAYYLGIGKSGHFKFRTPFKTGYSDPTPVSTVNTTNAVVSELDTEQVNRVIVHGVRIVEDSYSSELWNAFLTGNFTGNHATLIEDVDDGDSWPDPTTYPGGYWAKYVNIVEAKDGTEVLTNRKNKPQLIKLKINNEEDEIVGATSVTLYHRETTRWPGAGSVSPLTFTVTTLDTTTRLDAAKVLLTNSTGQNGTLWECYLRGKKIHRYSGSKGTVHDKFRDDESIRDNGELAIEVGNNYISTNAMTNQIADYLWKDNHVKKHRYRLTIPGEWHEYEPGEWYTVQIGGAGKAEYIDATCRLMAVQIDRTIASGSTTLLFREVEQNWTFDSNAVARAVASGSFINRRGGREMTVAASTYNGPADLYCDGTADESELQEAINTATAQGGGIVRLTQGTYNTTAAISLYSNVVLVGMGANTVIKKNANDYAIESVGSGGSELTNVQIHNLKVTRDAGDTNANALIYFTYTDHSLIRGVTVEDPYAEGIYLYYSDFCTVGDCTVLNPRTHGIRVHLGTDNTVYNCTIDGESTDMGTNVYGLRCEASTPNTKFTKCAVTNLVRRGYYEVIGIYVWGKYCTIEGCIVSNLEGGSATIGIYTNDSSNSDTYLVVADNVIQTIYDDGLGVGLETNCSSGTINGNQVIDCWGTNSGYGGGIYLTQSSNTIVANNMVRDCGNMIRNGSCEGDDLLGVEWMPSLIAESTAGPTLSNCTYANTNAEAYSGSNSYILTKTIAAGTAAYVSLGDNESTSDLHGFQAGKEYTFTAWVYIPSTGGPLASEVSIEIGEYYSAAWNTTTDAAATQDAWEQLSINVTLNANTTGVRVRINCASAASNTEYFYTDTMRIKPHGMDNELEVNFKDSGTGTILG